MADERRELLDLRRLAELEAKAGPGLRPARPEPPGIGKRLYGAGENVMSMLTGGLIEAPAGISGIVDGVASFIRGDADPLHDAVQRINGVREKYTFQPKTEAGQQMQQDISVPFQKFGEATRAYGGLAQDVSGGSPLVGTIFQTVPELALSLVGKRGKGPTMRQRAADVSKLRGYAEDVGFDMSAEPDVQSAQVVSAAERMTGGRQTVASGFENLQTAIQNARRASRDSVTALYDDARATNAGVRVSSAKNFERNVRTALADFDIADMPIVQRRLNELSEVSSLPDNAIIKLNGVARYRQRINRNPAAATDTAQQAALGILKGELDSFLESEFNSNMITGDPQAIIKWKMANDAYRGYKETFDANRTIRQLGQQQATPEEMRRWIFGANAVGAKKEAATVVQGIKRILGEDSPQMSALRQDALLDIVAPLMEETPNFRMFQRKYDQFQRNNPTLAQELFPESVSELDKLRAFAGAMKDGNKGRLQMDMEQALSRVLFGHGIARAAMKVSFANQALKLMRSTLGKSEQTRLMGDILGYDPSAPLLPYGPAVQSGVIQSQMQEGR